MGPFVVAAAAFGIWWVGSRIAIPWVLGLLHRAGPNPVSDRLMGGRAEVPLQSYVEDWTGLLPDADYVVLTALLVAALAVAAARVVRRTPTRSATGKPGETPSLSDRLGRWALTGVGVGAVAGLAEAYQLAAKLFHLRETPAQYLMVGAEAVWVVVLVDMVALGLVGGIWALVSPRSRLSPRVDRHLGLAVLVALGTLSVLGVSGRMHPAVMAFLALAVGVRVGSPLARRPDALQRWSRRGAVAGVSTAALLLLAQVSITAARDRAPEPPAGTALERPNLLLIVLDTERAQSWRLLGGDRQTTAQMEAWSRRGVTYERAIAPASWTLPSHASMLTGVPTWRLAVAWDRPMRPEFTSLAEYLAARGYRTAGFVGNTYFLGSHYGLDQGFQRWDDHRVTAKFALTSSWVVREVYSKVRDWMGLPMGVVEKTAADVSGPFLDWVDRQNGSAPFLVLLNYYDAHAPYTPLDEHRRYSSPGGPFWLSRGNQADAYPPGEVQALEDAYEDEIAQLDEDIGELFTALDQRGLLENTVVAVTSDHGEEFGEHGLLDHDMDSLYRTLIHVPLVLFGPGIPGDVRVQRPVSLTDIPATFASLAGFPDHPFPTPPLPLGTDRDPAPSPAFAAFESRFSVVHEDLHYIRGYSGEEELYAWAADPWEQDNLAERPEFADGLRRMRILMEEWIPDREMLPSMR